MTKDQKENLADALNYLDDGCELVYLLSEEVVPAELYIELRRAYVELEEVYLEHSHRYER